MVVHNPNNWHWVDKNCISWARQYFEEKTAGVKSAPNDSKSVEITSLSSLEGDCEVSQRKGKVISLFDLKVVLMMKGNVDDEDFEGSITIPEIAFDSERDDYQFEISIYKETGKSSKARPLIKEEILPQLRDIFSKFGPELLQAHANDIQVPSSQVASEFTKGNLQQPQTSGSVSPAPTVSKALPKSNENVKTSSASGSSNAPLYNTTTLHLEPTFNVPAIELYQTFLDKQRVQAWSRSPLISEGSKSSIEKGDEFTLFGGNVTSKLVECDLGKRLVFEWRLNEWRKGHSSVLAMEFHESKEYHETKLQVTWSGVPVGEEDKVKGNFMDYYVRSIKLTFGFGAVL
ncbi:LANO_0G07272g1_1 [Lachancea nothofagi CBS 11611]|uniref:LANO_0G07272g1_1 n=1 Tax=Lachancea nothofagi CBS 11611 TaxID=1266666 RepID=A0A1G4KHI8_9SACH|nr:LANO_0G07272g1_1 [Lachancea nothofagi CBS 11611]